MMKPAASLESGPPSIAFAQLLRLLDAIAADQDAGYSVDRLDKAFWERHPFEKSIESKLRLGLRFLGVLSGPEHIVKQALKDLANPRIRVAIPRDILSEKYAGVLRSAYRPDVTRRDFEEQFGEVYGIEAISTIRKAVTFFVSAAEYTQLNLAESLRPGGNNLLRLPTQTTLPVAEPSETHTAADTGMAGETDDSSNTLSDLASVRTWRVGPAKNGGFTLHPPVTNASRLMGQMYAVLGQAFGQDAPWTVERQRRWEQAHEAMRVFMDAVASEFAANKES